ARNGMSRQLELGAAAARGARVDCERETANGETALLLQLRPVDLVHIGIDRVFVVRGLELGANLVVPQGVGLVFRQLFGCQTGCLIVISTAERGRTRRRRGLPVAGPETLAGQSVVVDVVILLVFQHDFGSELALFVRALATEPGSQIAARR